MGNKYSFAWPQVRQTLITAPSNQLRTFSSKATSAAVAALVLTTTGMTTTSQKAIVPGGTTVTVVVVNPISSSTAKVNDTFAIQTGADVVSNGWIVIAKGAPGQGTITSVDHAGSHGHPGSLGIQMDWIYAVDGEKVRLTSQNINEEGESKAGVSSTVTIISWATLGLAGLFAHNFVKGRDVVLDDKIPLKAYVSESVYVLAQTRSTDADAGFAKAVSSPVPTPAIHSSPPAALRNRRQYRTLG